MPKTKTSSKLRLNQRSKFKFDKTLLAVIAAVVVATGGYLFYRQSHAATLAIWQDILKQYNCPYTNGWQPPTLQYGSTGNCVKFLQFNLELGTGHIGGPPKEDGIFGSNTLYYVKEFQGQNSLKVDGIVGPATWLKLDSCVNDKSSTISGMWVCRKLTP